MKKEIIINATLNEVRIAITENGKFAELFIELPDKERSIGNIYLGKVNKVIQGINAAFISIGQKQDAFLHFSDVDESLENLLDDMEDEEIEENDDDQEPDLFDNLDEPREPEGQNEDSSDASDIALRKASFEGKKDRKTQKATFRTKKFGDLQINLEPKQDVIVQVVREAYSSKGVRVTTKIAIPGRYTVLLPFDSMVGVSKKIGTYQERRRLRFLAKTSLPEGFGCIIRTAAIGKSENELKKDWENLINTWKEIEEKVKNSSAPTLVYQDMHLATSVIRDLFTKEVSKVHIDSKKLYKEITTYLKWASPNLVNKVVHYDKKKPIFDAFNIEKELETTYLRKVDLQSGGSIVIDQTEAMTVIDVNSGRSISEKQQEKTAFKTDLEAAREIARQVRLRDISGIIIIDFIDIKVDANKKKLFAEMKKEMYRDRAKAIVYPLTQLCLMQLTRQRINQNIAEKTSETCPMCHGSGRIASKAVLLNGIERWLSNFRAKSKEFRLVLYVHPHVASYLAEGALSKLSRLMIKYFVKIKVQQSEHTHIDQFRFMSVRKQKDITNDYM